MRRSMRFGGVLAAVVLMAGGARAARAEVLYDVVPAADFPAGSLVFPTNPTATGHGFANVLVGGGHQRAFVDGILIPTPAIYTEPPPSGEPDTYAYGIDDAGAVVGSINIHRSDVARGFVYSGGVFRLLPDGPGTGINDHGSIVGFNDHGAGAYIDAGGTETYLDDLVDPALHLHILGEPKIDDAGRILVDAVTINPERDVWTDVGPVVLVPRATPAVPEPSTLALAGVGGLALVGYAWRRRRPARAPASVPGATVR